MKNLREDKYLFCWENWPILYSWNHDEANITLKKIDRRRFPIHPERDIFMMANTWGAEDMRPECLYAAREKNVLEKWRLYMADTMEINSDNSPITVELKEIFYME